MANLPTRNNNPGDLKDPSTGTFKSFTDPQQGFDALKQDLQGKITGNTKTGLNGNSTLAQFASVYAPSSDNNDPTSYANKLATKLGVTSDTPIGKLSDRLDDFASAIADNEGYQGNRVSGATESAQPAQEIGSSSLADFGKKIQAKYPQYADMDPATIGQKILQKYPQYADMVSGGAPTNSDGYNPTPYSKPTGGNLTGLPSGGDAPQPETPPQKPGFIQGAIQGLASPFLQVASSVKGLYDTATGNTADYNKLENEGQDYGYFGKVKPVGGGNDVITGSAGDAAKGLLSAAGTGAQLGIDAATVGGAVSAVKGLIGGSRTLSAAAPIINDISGVSEATFNAASASEKYDALSEALSKSTSASDKMVLNKAINEILPSVSKELGLEPSLLAKLASKTGSGGLSLIKTLLRAGLDVAGLETLKSLIK